MAFLALGHDTKHEMHGVNFVSFFTFVVHPVDREAKRANGAVAKQNKALRQIAGNGLQVSSLLGNGPQRSELLKIM
jgi:hypothetical protein